MASSVDGGGGGVVSSNCYCSLTNTATMPIYDKIFLSLLHIQENSEAEYWDIASVIY